MGDKEILGIDLGTTNSAMGVMEAGDPEILQNAESERLTKSVVRFDSDSVAVGKRAVSKADIEPESTYREVKLDIGKGEEYEVNGETYTPADASAEILKKLREDASKNRGEDIKDAVVTVPAYFTADQKKATKKAAEMAGFENVKLLNEPSAAALAHGEGKDFDGHTLLVYDFGGGTLDTSLLEVDGDKYSVQTTTGNNELGGRDFTGALMEEIASRYEDENGTHLLDDTDDLTIKENLRDAAEQAKISLSADKEVDVVENYLGEIGDGDIVSINTTITRDRFEEITEDLREKARKPIKQAKEDTKIANSEIDEVLLVGGSTQIPSVKEMVAEETDTDPTVSIDPDKIVAQGAVLYTESDAAREFGLLYICKESGEEFETRKGLKQHKIEAGHKDSGWKIKDKETGEIIREDESEGEDPPGGEGGGDKVIIQKVTRSLGTQVKGGKMAFHVEKDTLIDNAEETKYYTTTKDDQTVIPIDVYQGESEEVKNNEKLAGMKLKGIEPMDAGEPIIEVTFFVDDNEILNVTAVDVTEGDGGERKSLTVEEDIIASGTS